MEYGGEQELVAQNMRNIEKQEELHATIIIIKSTPCIRTWSHKIIKIDVRLFLDFNFVGGIDECDDAAATETIVDEIASHAFQQLLFYQLHARRAHLKKKKKRHTQHIILASNCLFAPRSFVRRFACDLLILMNFWAQNFDCERNYLNFRHIVAGVIPAQDSHTQTNFNVVCVHDTTCSTWRRDGC